MFDVRIIGTYFPSYGEKKRIFNLPEPTRRTAQKDRLMFSPIPMLTIARKVE